MNKKEHEHNHDGIDNHEHFLDMFSQAEMLFQNIKDNTDGVFQLLKIYEEQGDEDIVDVIKIDAGEILEIEKTTQPIFEEIKKLKNSIKDENDFFLLKNGAEKYFDFILKNEEKSSLIYNNLIKKIK